MIIDIDGPHDETGETRSPDGTRIGWFRDGAGPPLLLVHGTTADHSTWRVSGPLLAAERQTFAIDRRGRGSSGDTLPYSIVREFEDLAAVAVDVADARGMAVDVVGHSYGGRVALGAAVQTAAIRRIVVYEGAPAARRARYQAPDLVERLRVLIASGEPAEALRTFMREVVGMGETELDDFEAAPVWPLRVAAAHTIVRELEAEASDEADLQAFRELRKPVLQILGGSSRNTFREATLALDDLLSTGRVVILAGQRHDAHHRAPDAFVAAVRQFLAE